MPSVLKVDRETPKTLVFGFPGVASAVDLDPVFEAIKGHLKRPLKGIRKVVFDLSTIDPIKNNAGRILDAATEHHTRLRSSRIGVQMRMPRSIYEDLQRLDDLPKVSGSRTKFRGMNIELVDPDKVHENEVDEALSHLGLLLNTAHVKTSFVLLTCLGKVREIAENKLGVSLFTDEGEIIGDLEKRQFPNTDFCAGQVFRYTATIRGPGKTEIEIKPQPEKDLSSAELQAIRHEIETKIPPDDIE